MNRDSLALATKDPKALRELRAKLLTWAESKSEQVADILKTCFESYPKDMTVWAIAQSVKAEPGEESYQKVCYGVDLLRSEYLLVDLEPRDERGYPSLRAHDSLFNLAFPK